MPRRRDLESICLIGSGPIVIGQACEFDYSGCQALKVLREDGFRTIVVNSNPATIMTDPGFADRTYIEPLDFEGVADVLRRERPDALLPTMGGQTALNLAVELAESGTLADLGVELIGAPIDVIRRAEDRERFRETVQLAGLRVPESTIVTSPTELPESLTFPVILRPAFTLGGHGGGTARSPEELETAARARAPREPGRPGARRGVAARLGRVRARGHAGPQRQRGHRLLDREPRPDGRAHGRLGHGRAADDALGRGLPGAARRDARRRARRRGRDGRGEHPVRARARDRRAARDRDEPARVALLGARVEGDRLSDRQGRREARGRLHARRDPERPHGHHAGQLRADSRLRRRQVPALRVREVPRRRPDAGHPDEVGRRGDGHRPHLRRGLHEGHALARARRGNGDTVGRSRLGAGRGAPVVQGRARPRHRRAGPDRERPRPRRRRLGGPQAPGDLGRGRGGALRRDPGSRPRTAAGVGRAAGLPPGRFLRRRGRGGLELLLLDLGRGRRGAASGATSRAS